MNVLIVCNNAYMKGNGMCTAIRTLKNQLRGKGIEARVMASANPEEGGEQPDYVLGHFKFPFFESLIYASGFRYAKVDKKVVEEALEWADVLHLEEGFPVEAKIVKMAEEAGIPCVGTYHLFSENILANLGFKNEKLINGIITWFWRKTVYDHCKTVQCPTDLVKEYLTRAGFKSELRVISNGISLADEPVEVEAPLADPYTIACIGRYANEKDQKTLLEAVSRSKYASKIRLVFAGKGPKEKKLRRIASKLYKEGVLQHEPQFGFYGPEKLKSIAREAYLVVHCAYVEIEGLSCIEAIREGAVPIIASGKMTATSVFALDERSTFPERDSKTLSEKIDWWIEHPQERLEMGRKYAEYARKFNISDSMDAIIRMYENAIAE